MDHLRYPIGRSVLPDPAAAAELRTASLTAIGELPARLAESARNLRAADRLDGPYRPGGWTARQVIHHLADSHANAYVRHKRILTEDHPTLTPYDEVRWADLADVTAVPVAASLEILRGLHLRWATLLATCTEEQWLRTGVHAASGTVFQLDQLAAEYAWHGQHHLAHLRLVLAQN